MNTVTNSNNRSTQEELLLDRLESIMTFVSAGFIGDGKYEIELFGDVIQDSPVLGQDQKREYMAILKNVTHYLNIEKGQYQKANSLLWNLHSRMKGIAVLAIRQASRAATFNSRKP